MKASKRSRFLSALLALVMVVSLLPVSALAADVQMPAAEKVTVTSASDITAGTYLICGISAQNLDDGTSSAFMSASGSTASRLMSEQLEANDGKITAYNNSAVWNLIEADGGFYVQNAGNGMYLYYGTKTGNNIYQTANLSEAGVWTVVANGDFWTLQEVASDRQLSANRFGSAGSYYLGFAAYTATSSCKRSLEFYKIGETAKNHVIESLDELTDGAQVVIFNPANMMALSQTYAGNYNAGAELTEDNGKLEGFTETELWTVTANEDGTYTFATADGKKLSMDTQYSSMPLDKVNDTWIVTETDGGYFINNVGRDEANSYRIEWYADKGNWSSYYKNNDGDLFVQQFYLVVEPLDEPDPQPTETPEPTEPVNPNAPIANGDKVVIYNKANMKALSSEYNGFYNMGVDVTLENGKLNGITRAVIWTVSANTDGTFSFTPLDGTAKLGIGASYTSMPLGEQYDKWNVINGKDDCWRISNAGRTGYVEWYADKSTWSAANFVNDTGLFDQVFYIVSESEIPQPVQPSGDLPKEGDQIVIYNAAAEGVIGMADSMGVSMTAVPAVVNDGIAQPGNGALVFTVHVSGNYFTFESNGKYLCTNADEALFMSDEQTEYTQWTLAEKGSGYLINNKTAKYYSSPVCIEYYSDAFSGWSYKADSSEIFEFSFYPAEEGTTVTEGVVNKPEVVFNQSDAYIGMDYTLKFSINAVFGVQSFEIFVNDAQVTEFSSVNPDEHIVKVDSGNITAGGLVARVSGTDNKGVAFSATYTVTVFDEPVITDLQPSVSAQTGDNKRPVISARIVNGGENPVVTMLVNDKPVDAVFENGVITYTPAEDMADGRANVTVNAARADGKTVSKSWSFTVGESKFQLYFGQLHSHTGEYSDGSGTLSDALTYIKDLPDSANVQFVAFTDHSNYFDASGAANPEGALYDMSLATSASKEKWAKYKATVDEFNNSQNEVVAIAGFEMTWSGGPGHINTFNTPGIVSRNNTTLNNKTDNAGMRAYYALLDQNEGANSLSQFNHPGSTFGTFADFGYWDAVSDSRFYMVEVGNGEGQIGAGGYYPSYEYYIMALDKGWHVAPTNNQDNHKGKWGNANDARDVILTDDFTENGIYNALRDMRVYSTEDKNLEVYYTVNGFQLGSSITEVPDMLNVNVSVFDPDAKDSISKVEVVVNSGKVIHTWDSPADLATGEFAVDLSPDYSYYFIRVTEGDGDLAVTAPVWVGESLKLGISSLECGTSTPVTGEPLTLSTTVFNSEASAATIKAITYTTDGGVVLGIDTTGYTVDASGSYKVDFSFTPEIAKVMTVTATVVIEQNDKEFTFTKDISLDVLDAESLVYIGIDAAHYNEYVAGNYADSMGNFSALAAGYSVRTVELKTSADLIAACSNDKYKALILTAPSRRLAAAQSDPRSYTADELAAIAEFNAKGGTVIVAGWSDYYENYQPITENPDIKHMAATQNELLAALGSSLRIGDDATNDDSLNGGQTQRLYFNAFNMDSFLMNGVEVDAAHPNDALYTERFSQYGGASVYSVGADGAAAAELPAGVTPVVFGHTSTYLKDSDNDGAQMGVKYSYTDGDERYMVLASEQLEGRGLIIVSGAAFMSNFEVQYVVSDSGSEKNYSNYKVCQNLLQFINPVTVTDIAAVRAQSETGYKYTIEGTVTSNASGYDKDTAFFDCIYVEDGTAGLCCFPVAGNYKVGDMVRITGTTDYYQGEPELQISSIEVISEGIEVAPAEITAAQLNDRSAEGSLVTVKGTVLSFEYENGLVQTIMVKDAEGNVARVFIDGYITTAKDVENLAIGCEIAATGLASYDDTFNAPDGPFSRIRVRDRADIVCTAVACDHANTVIQGAKPASCTEEGYTGDKVCTVCETLIEQGEVIPVLPHMYITEVVPASADKCGYTVHKCTLGCGDEYYTDYTTAAPVNVKADYLISTGAPYIKWSAIDGAKEYKVYRCGYANGTYECIGTTGNLYFNDTTAKAPYTYYYQITSVSADNYESAFSVKVAGVCHCAQPVVKTDFKSSTGAPYIKWSSVNGAVKYEVYRAAYRDGNYSVIGTTESTAFTDNTAKTGYTYFYKVKAISARGNANSYFSTAVYGACHCAQPVLKVNVNANGNPSLSWNAVAGASGYSIYRSTDGINYSLWYTTAATSVVNSGLESGTTYYYKVRAISNINASVMSAASTAQYVKIK